MARQQSRRSISIQRELYDQLGALAEREHIPLSQLVGQAIAALLAGAVPLQPARRVAELGAETLARRAAARAAAPVPKPPIGTCANCGGDKLPVMPTQLVAGGPTYKICTGCNGERARGSTRRRRRAVTEARP